jgi:hypothetical protein
MTPANATPIFEDKGTEFNDWLLSQRNLFIVQEGSAYKLYRADGMDASDADLLAYSQALQKWAVDHAKQWANGGALLSEFTTDELTAVIETAQTDARMQSYLMRLQSRIEPIRAASPLLAEARDYMLSLSAPPVAAERWSAILGA